MKYVCDCCGKECKIRKVAPYLGYDQVGHPIDRLVCCNASFSVIHETEKTLRDEFAMAALTGILGGRDNRGSHSSIARHCYEYADAMMGARK